MPLWWENLDEVGELLSTSIYSGGRGGGGLEDGSPKGAPLQNMHPPKVGGCSMGAPSHTMVGHGGSPKGAPPPSNTPPPFVGGSPHHGPPPTSFPPKGGCPPKGAPPKNKIAPTKRGRLSPRQEHCFSRAIRKILEGPKTFPAPSKIFQMHSKTFPAWWFTPKHFRYDGLLRNISGISETFPVFSPETFPSSPKLFRWLSLRLLT